MIENVFYRFLNLEQDLLIPKKFNFIFAIFEYMTYFIACLIIIYTFIIQTKLIFKFLKSYDKDLSNILKIRLVIARILNLSLTLILAGHIIRLTYLMNIKTFLMLIFIILVRELLRKYLDKEVKNVSKNYYDLINIEKQLNTSKI